MRAGSAAGAAWLPLLLVVVTIAATAGADEQADVTIAVADDAATTLLFSMCNWRSQVLLRAGSALLVRVKDDQALLLSGQSQTEQLCRLPLRADFVLTVQPGVALVVAQSDRQVCSLALQHSVTALTVPAFAGCVSDTMAMHHCFADCHESQLLRVKRATTCTASQCKNGGVCNSHSSNPWCICPIPYLAPYCATSVNYCSTTQPHFNITDLPVCYNNATCNNTLVEPYFTCDCLPGFTGNRCEIDINECQPNPCVNGNCTDLINGYTCSCNLGWSGVNCSVNIDDCVGAPCQNGGVCIDGINSYTCNCNGTGFNGANCTQNIDDCASSPCQNGGNCTDGINNYTCSCYPGYSGVNCTDDYPDCNPSPCQFGGSCLERSNQSLYGAVQLQPFNSSFAYAAAAGYECQCLPGSSGQNCSINPDDCTANGHNVCQHATSCTDGLNNYTCHCQPGYAGVNCSVNIDECALYSACSNGAKCVDLVNNYRCDCVGNYGGRNCSVQLTGCAGHQCQNGATCRPVLLAEVPTVQQSYSCNCAPGWTAARCNITSLVSLNSSAAVVEFGVNASARLSLSLRTSLSDCQVAQLNGTWGSLSVKIVNRTLSIVAGNATVERAIADQLTATSWLTVVVDLADGRATFSSGSVSLGSDALPWLVAKFVPGAQSLALGGGAWLGCFRDVALDTSDVTEATASSSPTAVWGSCHRQDPCQPSPCSQAGTASCTDLWQSAACVCKVTHAGKLCSNQLAVFTFGHASAGGAIGWVSVATNAKFIRFNLVTLTTDAFVLALGNDAAGVQVLINGGQLLVQVRNGTDLIASVQSAGHVTNGLAVQIGIRLLAASQQLIVDIDNSRLSTPSGSVAIDLVPTVLLIGGYSGARAPVAAWHSRARRALDVNNNTLPNWSAVPAIATAFKGVLSAIWLDGAPLFNNATGTVPGAIEPAAKSNVLTAATTDDVCTAYSPCANGAACANVFYNSYRCSCGSGWRGTNCTEIDYCATGSATCPNGTECANVGSNGFECRSTGTFGAGSSTGNHQLHYKLHNSSSLTISSITGSIRTRSTTADLLRIGNLVRVAIDNSQMSVSLDSFAVLSTANASDGEWHNFTINWSTGQPISVTVTSGTAGQLTNHSSGRVNLSLTIDPGTPVLLATNFKGCLGNLRLGELLLPLQPHSAPPQAAFVLLTNRSGARLPSAGCHGDQVCSACLNGANCTDLWNLALCSCKPGYSGNNCAVPDCAVVTCASTAGVSTPLVVVFGVVALIVVIVIIIVVLLAVARNRRSESGLYKPSRQEQHHDSRADTEDTDLDNNFVFGNVQVARL